MRSLEVTDELLAAAEHRLQYTRDDGLLACLARAIVAQAKGAPAAQAGLPAAEVAVTTENLDVCERRIENSKGKLERYEYSPGDHDECGLVAFWEAKRAAKVDIRANLARVQAECARAREVDRRRIEELASEVGRWQESSKRWSDAFHASEDREADLRRQLGEAKAEVADLLPRLDAAALENTQLGRERDGARNELAEAIKNKDTLIIENNSLLCRAEDAESDRDDLRAWKESAMAVMAEWDGLRKLVEDGSPAQLGRGLAENTERVIRDLRAKVERRTALLTTWLGLHDHPSARWGSTKPVAEETRVELGKDNEHAR